jgi:rod shape-determining protein MreC
MQFLLTILRVFREYIVLLLLCAISLILISQSNSPSVRVVRSAAIAFIGTIQSTTGWLTLAFGERFESEALKEVNLNLMEEVLELRRLRQENDELRGMLGFKQREDYSLVAAEIVGKNGTHGTFTLTLDAGSSDSIRETMPVITEQGLVGRVVAVSAHYSIVQLALNREFRVTAMVNRSRIDGILRWKIDEKLLLENIWKTADIVVGDTIVTSEYSAQFPPGIPVGTVQHIGPSESGQFSDIVVKPQVNFVSLERVFVLLFKPNYERRKLEEEVRQNLNDGGVNE